MNKLAFIFLLLAGLHSFGQKQPMLYLPFEASMEDVSLNPAALVARGNVELTMDRFGDPCGAVELYNRGYIEIANHNKFNRIYSEFSFMGWFKLRQAMNPHTWLTVLCKGDEVMETDNNPHFRVQVFQSPLQSVVSINTAFTEYDDDYKQHLFKENEWFHFSLIYNGFFVETYLNGNLVWSFHYTGTLQKNNSPLFIGKDIPGYLEFFEGSIDDFYLYDYAVPKNEINNHYTKQGKAPTPTGSTQCPDDIDIYLLANHCEAVVHYKVPKLNACSDDTIELLKGMASGSLFRVGVTENVNRIQNGDEIKVCRNRINVIDTISPVISGITDTIIRIDGSCWNTEGLNISAIDNCMMQKLSRIDAFKDIDCLAPGTYLFKYEAEDLYGNSAEWQVSTKIISDTITAKPISVPVPVKSASTATSSVPIPIPIPKTEAIAVKDSLNFKSRSLTIMMYDNQTQDQDRVSVYFNNSRIIDNATIQNQRNGIIKFTVQLVDSVDNELVIQALNLGKVGKNTCQVDFYNKEDIDLSRDFPVYSKTYNSIPGFAAAIKLNYIK